jgi:hypothetical protein
VSEVSQLPLPVALASSPAPQLDGDAAAHLGQRRVRQLRDMEPVDHQPRVRQAGAHCGVDRHDLDCGSPRGALRLDPRRYHCGRAALDLPEQPGAAAEIDHPDMPFLGHHLPPLVSRLAGHEPEPGLAAPDLVDAETCHLRCLARQREPGVGGERGLRDRPGHSWSRAAWITVRPWSATAAPIEARSRPVSRARGGICGTDSVNVARSQASLRQRQRRFVQISAVWRPATGRSRGRVRTHECGCCEYCPHPGQHRPSPAAVTSAIKGLRSASSRTETASTPSRPSSRVVSLTKPVAPSRSLLSQQLE